MSYANWLKNFMIVSSLSMTSLVSYADICHEPITILQKPIQFQQLRHSLTKIYQHEHYGITKTDILIHPKIIVLHWTSTHSFKLSYDLFNPETLTGSRPELKGKLNISSHYLVDRNGDIYQLMPDNWLARHVVGLNHAAIGIENVGGLHDQPDLTEAQVESNAKLVCHLKKKYPQLEYVIGHQDYLKFKNSIYWLEKDTSYEPQKPDPGRRFIQQVNHLTSHLGLKDGIKVT